jgi:uncharacterized protein (TIGR03083 family)
MRPTPVRYLEEIRAQGDALARAAAGRLEDAVPPCPGWTVRDAVVHTGTVHRHKEQIVREGFLDEQPDPPAGPPAGADLLAWYAAGLDRLLDTLAAADPATPAFTWYPGDQTVGFWYRRMAHETAVHRADVESATGRVAPLPPDIAVDGIDELLGPTMCAYTDDPQWDFRPDGRAAVLRAHDHDTAFCLLLGEGKYGPGWVLEPGDHRQPAAVISAPASDLDLWAWGRLPGSVLALDGDPTVPGLIRKVAREATQ